MVPTSEEQQSPSTTSDREKTVSAPTTAQCRATSLAAEAPAAEPPMNPVANDGEGDTDVDVDSAIGDDEASSTASLTSSILAYRTLHGRRYHSEIGNAMYWGSNDDTHGETLDLYHQINTLLRDDELFMSPVLDPRRILDIGTGTGIWAVDVGDAYPDCEVTGTDISPTQTAWVPPNVKFEMEDCTGAWTFPEDAYDLVHIQVLSGCIVDWTALFKEAFRCTKPGGYLESTEASPQPGCDDGTFPENTAISKCAQILFEVGQKIGRSFTVLEDGTQRRAMQEAGFVDIQERNTKCPSGGWAKDPKMKELGRLTLAANSRDLEGLMSFMTSIYGWSEQESIVHLALTRRELLSQKYHIYYRGKTVWGRKPGPQRAELR